MPAERRSVIFIFESRCFLETTQYEIATSNHFPCPKQQLTDNG